MFYQILALLIWGSSFIAAKYSYEMIDPALMVEARLLIAALMVLPSCRRHLGRIPRSEWKPLLWISFVNYVVVLMLQFIGLKYTSAASAVTMVGLEPLLVVFVGHFFFNDKAKIYHWICGAAAFAGVGMMVMGGAEEGGTIDWFGCLLIFACRIGFCRCDTSEPADGCPYRCARIYSGFHGGGGGVVSAVFAGVGRQLSNQLVMGRYAVDFVYGDWL